MFEISSVTVGGVVCANWDNAAKELGKQLFDGLERAGVAIRSEVELTLKRVSSTMAERHSEAWPISDNMFGTASDRLTRRSGAGLASLLDSVSVSRGPGAADIAYGSISAGLLTKHETGAVVSAKRGKYLAIPLRAVLDQRGLPLKSSPRDWPNTFIRQTRRGGLFIFQRQGRKAVPLYLLKNTVTIKPRLGLGEAFDAQLGYFESKALLALEKEFGA